MNKKDLEKLGLNAEALEKAGLTDEVLDKIIVLHGKDIEAHKTSIQTAGERITELEGQLKEAGETIEGFKGMDVEGVKKSADDWKAKAEKAEADAKAAKEEADTKITTLKFDHALESALSEAKAKNPKAVRALLNLNDLKQSEDGAIVGLAEQLEKVRTENDYLFESDEKTPKVVIGSQSKPVINDAVVAAAREAAGIPEGDK